MFVTENGTTRQATAMEEQLQAENAALKAELAKQQLCIEKMQNALDDAYEEIGTLAYEGYSLPNSIIEALALQPSLNALREHDAAIREQCAKWCDELHDKIQLVGVSANYPGEYGSEEDMGYGSGVCDCAERIRKGE
jgi:hypothetical protein